MPAGDHLDIEPEPILGDSALELEGNSRSSRAAMTWVGMVGQAVIGHGSSKGRPLWSWTRRPASRPKCRRGCRGRRRCRACPCRQGRGRGCRSRPAVRWAGRCWSTSRGLARSGWGSWQLSTPDVLPLFLGLRGVRRSRPSTAPLPPPVVAQCCGWVIGWQVGGDGGVAGRCEQRIDEVPVPAAGGGAVQQEDAAHRNVAIGVLKRRSVLGVRGRIRGSGADGRWLRAPGPDRWRPWTARRRLGARSGCDGPGWPH